MKKSLVILGSMIIVLIALSITIKPNIAQASIIAQDSFNYSPGALGGNNGGIGWSGAWTGNISVLGGGSLSYTDGNGTALQTEGNHVTAPGFSFRNLGRDLQNEDIWISFLIDRNFFNIQWAGVSLYNNGSEYLFMGKTGNTTNLGIHEWPINVQADIVNNSTDPVLFVTLLSLSDTGGSEWWAWINPELNSIPDTTTAGAHNTHPNLSVVDQIRIAGETGIEFDELRIGTSYWDVSTAPEPIPEPTTMLLLGTGLVGVAGAARRKKENQA